jgi:hypothetical protein
MQLDQRNHQVRTDTTRRLDADSEDKRQGGVVSYFEGARRRSAGFADSTSQLREIHSEIDRMGREAQSRPTGVLSGGDIDIAYHYLGMGLGIVALLYSLLGAVFALNGGGAALLATLEEHWATGPATALVNVALHPQTIVAIVLQTIIFVVMVGTRRKPQSWQHWTALIISAALTYAGWSSLLLPFAAPAVTALTATIPAALIGGVLGWAVVRISEGQPSRPLLFAIIAAGLIAGALGVVSLIHWTGVLAAWTADQVARRLIVVG